MVLGVGSGTLSLLDLLLFPAIVGVGAAGWHILQGGVGNQPEMQ